MIVNRLLKIILVILSITFIFLKIFKIDFYSDLSSVVLLTVYICLYLRRTKKFDKRKPYFLLFLLSFTLSEMVGFLTHFQTTETGGVNYNYFISNSLYMLAYLFLIIKCVITMKFKKIIKNFPLTLLILIGLSVFCVILITDTAQEKLSATEYVIEFVYNVVVMILLSVSLIGYMDKNDKKSILFFIGCMFVFFSEMLQLAYYYIEQLTHLAATYSIFLVLAFLFYYLQYNLRYEKHPNFNFLDSNT